MNRVWGCSLLFVIIFLVIVMSSVYECLYVWFRWSLDIGYWIYIYLYTLKTQNQTSQCYPPWSLWKFKWVFDFSHTHTHTHRHYTCVYSQIVCILYTYKLDMYHVSHVISFKKEEPIEILHQKVLVLFFTWGKNV